MPIIVDNKVITTPIIDIVNQLKQVLIVNHINKLKDIQIKNNNLRVTCPCHKNGMESNPSCDILLHDKQSYNRIIPAGTVNCFTCGYKSNLIGFIQSCLNVSYSKAKQWLLNSSDYDLLKNNRQIDLIEDKSSEEIITNYNELPIITDDELNSYRTIHPYMFQRKLSEEIIKKFDVGYDKITDAITFPVYSNGKCLFIAKRRIKYKRFDLPDIQPKPIYGLDYITDSSVIVCESVINALTCWTYGYQAIALFGTGSEYQLDLLNKSNIRHFILMFDGDSAGRKGAINFKKVVHNRLITDILLPYGKDVNNLTIDEFNKILNKESVLI